MSPRISAVIPTLGASPHLKTCLQALRSDGGNELEIVVVDQASEPIPFLEGLADRVLRPGRNLGFAEATNQGIAVSQAPLIATVNDDLVIHPGWCAKLRQALDRNPRLAAVQGIQTRLGSDGEVDGCGLCLDRWWQAEQLGYGEPLTQWTNEASAEIFGVSATAALYRRSALQKIALSGADSKISRIFDSSLGSYYEDVDLACRLRGAGFRAYRIAGARADHAGSETGLRRPLKRLTQLRGNRYAVMARLLGRSFWLRLPRMLERDLRDKGRGFLSGNWRTVASIPLGFGRAAWLCPRFLRLGAPLVPLAEVERFRHHRLEEAQP